MPDQEAMRFLFINQYGPPDPVPTARLLGELAEELRASGHAVEILSQSQSYLGRPARGGRLKRELQASWTILRGGLGRRGGRVDVVLALSSPPGIPAVAALLALRHRARLAHWAMDLYPELAHALGEIPKGSVVFRVVHAAMKWAYRRAVLLIALDDDMRARLQEFCPGTVRIMQPWSTQSIERQADEAAALIEGATASDDTSKTWTWLYSGNLGRAHEWQTLIDAQALLEARGLAVDLIFQGDGAARPLATAYAEKIGLRHCQWKGYASEEELLPALLTARVLIVTQRPETRGLLWPSKLALLERLPRPILFVGPEDGAIAQRLRERGNSGVFAPEQAEAVADWVEKWFDGRINWDPPSVRRLPNYAEQISRTQMWLVECGDSTSNISETEDF
jgi:colanic acid biosynthesis glycosyl transferase WcaI